MQDPEQHYAVHAAWNLDLFSKVYRGCTDLDTLLLLVAVEGSEELTGAQIKIIKTK